jgi:dipeptidyl aminopeptidase/acylaminoacyl peptidase
MFSGAVALNYLYIKDIMILKSSRIFIITLLCAMVISCGGGGGSSDIESPTQPSGQVINDGLNGYLFSEESGDNAYLIDISTGTASAIPNTDWENHDDKFPYGIARFYKYSVQNSHSNFLGVAVNCKGENSDPLSDSMSCIVIQDYSGNYISQLDLVHDVENIQLSPDGQYFALFRNFNPGVTDQEWFEVFTIDGRFISDKRLRSRTIQWLTNGAIVYGDSRNFVFTRPYSTDTDYSLTLPESLIQTGWISDFDISSDQSQIVFTIATDSTAFTSIEAKAYIMNIDGTNVRLLADVPQGQTANITDPTWSPDGKWILLEEGDIGGQDTNAPGVAGYLYVVPSEYQGKVYTLSVNANLRSPEVIQIWHDLDQAGPGTTLTLKTSGHNYEWIP